MFKTTTDLLEFIEEAKKAHIKSFKIGEIEVQFSDIAFLESFQSQALDNPKQTEEKNTSKTLVDTLPGGESDDEMLFWSTKG